MGAPHEPIKTAATPAYLTPAQVAELLQVSSKTVSRWALEDASMPVLRLGRVVRFPREELMRWMRRHLTQGSRISAEPTPEGRVIVAGRT